MQIETGTQRVFFPYKSDPFIAVGKIRTLEVTKDTRQDNTGKTIATNVFAVTIEVQHKVGEETITIPVYIKDARLYEAIIESVKKGKCPFSLVLDDKRNVKGYAPKDGQRFACVVSGRETDDNGKVKFTSKLFFVMGATELLTLPVHLRKKYETVLEHLNTPEGLYWGVDSDVFMNKFLALNGYIESEALPLTDADAASNPEALVAPPEDSIPF